MATRTIFLLRHGETVHDGDRPMIGSRDVALSRRGVEQAHNWALQFAGSDIAAVYCSDLVRSVDTAEILGASLRVPVEVIPQFREIHLGAWDGLTKAQIIARYPDDWRRRGEDLENFRPRSGESFADLRDRVVPAFNRLLSSPDGSLLIAGHAGVNRVILCHVLTTPLKHLFRIAQDFAAVSVIRECGGRMQVAAMNCRILPGPS